jgi:hypothetical protein
LENRVKRELADDQLTFRLGVNQLRTPNIAITAAAPSDPALSRDATGWSR